jgi:hypothetical protein
MTTPISVENSSEADPREVPSRRQQQIRDNVLAALGRPAGLLKVTVQPLWGDKFRVNVWAAGDNGAAIPNSYFVTADDSGSILRADPPLKPHAL